jgi:hypothetical protein
MQEMYGERATSSVVTGDGTVYRKSIRVGIESDDWVWTCELEGIVVLEERGNVES